MKIITTISFLQINSKRYRTISELICTIIVKNLTLSATAINECQSQVKKVRLRTRNLQYNNIVLPPSQNIVPISLFSR